MQINRVNSFNAGKNNTSFGSMAGFGEKILSLKNFKKLAIDPFEYTNFSMSVPTMMLILYGFTIPPRYANAVDHHDRREILTRDVTSITAILFFAKALSRIFSKTFAKISGFALNNTPHEHDKKDIFKKTWDYLNPSSGGGIDVLTSPELTLKYSNLENYKNGIHDFFKFVQDQDGDVIKVLSYNKEVKENADKILGKDIKTATFEEIDKAFQKAKGSAALKNIYKVFEKPDNIFVKKAKTMNSLFGFFSAILLVPAFMIWLEKFNEKTTKRLVAKEKAERAAKADAVAAKQNKQKTQINNLKNIQ